MSTTPTPAESPLPEPTLRQLAEAFEEALHADRDEAETGTDFKRTQRLRDAARAALFARIDRLEAAPLPERETLLRLLAASADVSPGPWTSTTLEGRDYHDLDERVDDGQGDFTAAVMATEDAALIVALRNGADSLLAALSARDRQLDEAQAVLDAAERFCGACSVPDSGEIVDMSPVEIAEAHDALFEAVDTYRAARGEEQK